MDEQERTQPKRHENILSCELRMARSLISLSGVLQEGAGRAEVVWPKTVMMIRLVVNSREHIYFLTARDFKNELQKYIFMYNIYVQQLFMYNSP